MYLPQLGTMMRDSMSNTLRHMCVWRCICLNWCPAVLFSYGRLLHDIADPFTIAVIKDDSGAIVQRSYIFCVLNTLNIVPSQKAHKLLGLPACAMILHLLHKNWPIRCGIIWIYHIYSEDKCWLPSGAPQKNCEAEDISIHSIHMHRQAYPTILCLSSWWGFPATNSIIGMLKTYLYIFSFIVML